MLEVQNEHFWDEWVPRMISILTRTCWNQKGEATGMWVCWRKRAGSCSFDSEQRRHYENYPWTPASLHHAADHSHSPSKRLKLVAVSLLQAPSSPKCLPLLTSTLISLGLFFQDPRPPPLFFFFTINFKRLLCLTWSKYFNLLVMMLSISQCF